MSDSVRRGKRDHIMSHGTLSIVIIARQNDCEERVIPANSVCGT